MRPLYGSLFLGIALLTCTASARSVEAPSQASVVLTAQENGTAPQNEFYCSGKIHAYIRLPATAVGQHTLEGIWIGPDGKVKEQSRVPLDFAPPGESMAYLWLNFEIPGLLGSLNPVRDQQRMSYNGSWQLQARWDGHPLLIQPFTVHCS